LHFKVSIAVSNQGFTTKKYDREFQNVFDLYYSKANRKKFLRYSIAQLELPYRVILEETEFFKEKLLKINLKRAFN
jgi:hypothetical protein